MIIQFFAILAQFLIILIDDHPIFGDFRPFSAMGDQLVSMQISSCFDQANISLDQFK